MNRRKRKIFEKVIEILEKEGFKITNCLGIHSCFDVFAKREFVLLIKILSNIEALTLKNSFDLRKISEITSGVPLLIADHMKEKKLLKGVIYSRYGINAINLETFGEILEEGEFPKIYSVRGNYCSKINPDKLINLRKKCNFTQEELAHELGVSKQSVYRYESYGNISIKIMEKILEFFKDDSILIPEEPFSFMKFSSVHAVHEEENIEKTDEFQLFQDESLTLTKLKKLVISDFKKIGFKISITHAPFDFIAIEIPENEKIFTLVSNDSRGLKRRAEIIRKISEMLNCYKVCISEKEQQNLEILVIKPEELRKISEPEELIEMLSEKEE